MTVEELIERLKQSPPTNQVMLPVGSSLSDEVFVRDSDRITEIAPDE